MVGPTRVRLCTRRQQAAGVFVGDGREVGGGQVGFLHFEGGRFEVEAGGVGAEEDVVCGDVFHECFERGEGFEHGDLDVDLAGIGEAGELVGSRCGGGCVEEYEA